MKKVGAELESYFLRAAENYKRESGKEFNLITATLDGVVCYDSKELSGCEIWAIIFEAKCLKQQEESGLDFVRVIPWSVAKNPSKKKQRLNGDNCFQLLDIDAKRYLHSVADTDFAFPKKTDGARISEEEVRDYIKKNCKTWSDHVIESRLNLAAPAIKSAMQVKYETPNGPDLIYHFGHFEGTRSSISEYIEGKMLLFSEIITDYLNSKNDKPIYVLSTIPSRIDGHVETYSGGRFGVVRSKTNRCEFCIARTDGEDSPFKLVTAYPVQ